MSEPFSPAFCRTLQRCEIRAKRRRCFIRSMKSCCCVCATIAGADDFVEIGLWGSQHQAFLRRFLPYKCLFVGVRRSTPWRPGASCAERGWK